MDKMQLTEDFRIGEFLCMGSREGKSCACHGALHPNAQRTAEMLQLVRDEVIKTSMLVLSAFRCDEHNKRIGGHPGSWHRVGLAADILYVKDDLETVANEIGELLKQEYESSGQVIYYPNRNFLHLDLGHYRPSLGRVRMNESLPKTRGY